ncbi:MAG: alpha/beta hydrolase [Gammaproteobacteria bacterium]|nr:alpha/beta hydrolase [Gammaproteobacteria bacterium]
MLMIKRWLLSLLPAVMLVLPQTLSAATEGYQEVTTKRGAVQPFWLIESDNAAASVILFAGGKGKLKITADGIKKKKNFLVRSRDRFAGHGFNVVVIDKPQDKGSLEDFRTTQEHADDIQAVIEFLHSRYNKPVWLIGTSRGTISAANAAIRLQGKYVPAGVVLTASVMVSGNRPSLQDVELDRITVPTLFVHNQSDQCHVSPYALVETFKAKLNKSRETALQTYNSVDAQHSNACKGMTPHGFLGIEDKVVAGIAEWIKQRL